MGPLGVPELIIIFFVALIFFGPRKLPELGRSLGKGLAEFKRTSNELRSTLDDEIRAEERRAAATPVIASAPTVADTSLAAGTPDSPDLDEPTDVGEFEPDTVARGDRTADSKPVDVS
jgi:TatA/E family protein of Tat protein translocase